MGPGSRRPLVCKGNAGSSSNVVQPLALSRALPELSISGLLPGTCSEAVTEGVFLDVLPLVAKLPIGYGQALRKCAQQRQPFHQHVS